MTVDKAFYLGNTAAMEHFEEVVFEEDGDTVVVNREVAGRLLGNPLDERESDEEPGGGADEATAGKLRFTEI
jgi:hypothetical protein